MFETNKNSVHNITGNNNQVIQIILQNGEKVTEKLDTLLEKLVHTERKEIEQLKKDIDTKESQLQDKQKIERLLDSENIQLKTTLIEKQHLLEQSEQRFTELLIANNGKDYSNSQELYPKALQAMLRGNKEEAIKILDRHKLIVLKEKLHEEKEQQAAAWLLRADLLKDDNTWNDELDECYEYAVETLSNWQNNITAANHFSFINEFDKANQYYQISLLKTTCEYEKATSLNNLGILQSHKNESDKALKSYDEALKIYRKLLTNNPKKFLPDTAATLNNLGNAQSHNNDLEKALNYCNEALKIYEKLAINQSNKFLPNIASILNNLGVLQKNKNDFNKALQFYNQALKINEKLAINNPKKFLPDLARTLKNLGALQGGKNDLSSYKQALKIYEKLAIDNPKAFLPNVAETLNSLGVLQKNKKKLDNALSYYNQALKIYEKLAIDKPQTFLPNIAGILNNLGVLQKNKNDFNKALNSYNEALKIS